MGSVHGVKPTVFFSWQSDSNKELNSEFIRSALEEGIKDVAVVELPIRVDSAAEGVSGTPDIPSTIFEKLTETAVAVFDVTPVGKTDGGKALPNPNVLLELGFAAALIGWDRIILVMNTGSGYEPEQIPFDLRHRRFPIRYRSTIGKVTEERDEWMRLCQSFKEYVAQALETTHRAVERARRRLSRDCPLFIEKFGKNPYFHWPHNEYQDELHRMIDLGFITYDLDPAEKLYAYHWTYLGHELCKWFFDRQKIPKVTVTKEHHEEIQKLLQADSLTNRK